MSCMDHQRYNPQCIVENYSYVGVMLYLRDLKPCIYWKWDKRWPIKK